MGLPSYICTVYFLHISGFYISTFVPITHRCTFMHLHCFLSLLGPTRRRFAAASQALVHGGRLICPPSRLKHTGISQLDKIINVYMLCQHLLSSNIHSIEEDSTLAVIFYNDYIDVEYKYLMTSRTEWRLSKKREREGSNRKLCSGSTSWCIRLLTLETFEIVKRRDFLDFHPKYVLLDVTRQRFDLIGYVNACRHTENHVQLLQ
jgi:hypothetical protein